MEREGGITVLVNDVVANNGFKDFYPGRLGRRWIDFALTPGHGVSVGEDERIINSQPLADQLEVDGNGFAGCYGQLTDAMKLAHCFLFIENFTLGQVKTGYQLVERILVFGSGIIDVPGIAENELPESEVFQLVFRRMERGARYLYCSHDKRIVVAGCFHPGEQLHDHVAVETGYTQ